MSFRRPQAPPPRALEVIPLGFGVFGFVGMFIFFVYAVSEGLISWFDVLFYQAIMLIGCLPIFAISYVLRRMRLKKAFELREYERTLAKLAERA